MAVALKIVLVIICIALIGVVLLQSGKSAGLGSISGGAEQIMGKAKARGIDAVLNKITVVLAALFIVLSITVAYIVK